MMHSMRFCTLVLLVATLAGCATTPYKPSTRPAQSKPAPASSGGTYDFRREGVIPPATDTRSESDVEEIAVSESALDVTEAEAPPDTARAAAPADSIVDGFRIQVFASADRGVAEETRGFAAERLGVPAYLDLENGTYKVRVGNYTSRDAADAALTRVRERYPDAWVVPARVAAPGRRTP